MPDHSIMLIIHGRGEPPLAFQTAWCVGFGYMSNSETYDALVELRQRDLPLEVSESVVEELNAILAKTGESGLGFKIPLEDLHERIIAITAGESQRTNDLIIDRHDFHRKVDGALEFFKAKKG
jgi:hypothetical protein